MCTGPTCVWELVHIFKHMTMREVHGVLAHLQHPACAVRVGG